MPEHTLVHRKGKELGSSHPECNNRDFGTFTYVPVLQLKYFSAGRDRKVQVVAHLASPA